MAKIPTIGPDTNVISLFQEKGSQIEHKTKVAPNPVQLALEFDKPRELIIVVTEQLHGATFLRWLHQCKPQVVVDLRFAPHFIFTAVDSRTVRREIDYVGARYILNSIPFHEFGSSLLRHDPMAIATQLSIFARRSGKVQWPIMVLVKELAVASAFSPFLVGAFSKDLGGTWTAEVVM
jgi:hypothetical protein